MKAKSRLFNMLVLPLLIPAAAMATDGYFSHGFGVKSQGMGGAGIALAQDGLAAASNPAGTILVEDRFDLGATWFAPKRSAEIVGNGVPGANGHYDGNERANFFIPEFGYVKHLSASTAVGVAVYGNGGMNTDYGRNPFAAFGSSGRAGVDLSQLFVSPSLAYKVSDSQALGAALNFAYQRFSASGLGAFAGSSVAPASLSDRGHDSSTGWGLRLGWSGHIVHDLTLGATWSSKIHASKFDKYRGLFADGGNFDIPENYGLGLAFAATPHLQWALDWEKIRYGDVKSIAAPLANLFAGNALGSANGPGFGWRDINVVKLGASYALDRALTVRAGLNHAGQPIPADQTFFNILAPGVVQNHLTLGATWKNLAGSELSLSYAHGFKKTVSGANSIPAPFGGGNANLALAENLMGVAYSWQL